MKKKSTKAESAAGDLDDEDGDSFDMDDRWKKTKSRRILGSGTFVEVATTAAFTDYHTADSTGGIQVTCLVKTVTLVFKNWKTWLKYGYFAY